MNEIVVWVVKSHNVTSGKGGYGLHGVFWDRNEAEAVAERLNLSKSPRLYSIHKFMEEAHG